MNYYNEFDPKAAAWLRELMAAGHISKGEIDTRSITDVQPSDLRGYIQCHFFAGIGGWSYALRLAGWPDDRPVWTGSCPCQPFSAAGRQMGRHDPRHLWPAFRRLINQCKPPVVFGEQVASAAGRLWLSGVFSDLEIMGYATAGSDLSAAGVGAPHIRQRLYWAADAKHSERRTLNVAREDGCDRQDNRRKEAHGKSGACGEICGLADAVGERRTGQYALLRSENERRNGAGSIPETAGRGAFGELGHSDEPGPQGRNERGHCTNKLSAWTPSVALACTDGKSRRTEPGIFPLAHGVSGRVGLLRGYGNAIVPQVAAEFIQAFQEADAGAGSGTVIEVDF